MTTPVPDIADRPSDRVRPLMVLAIVSAVVLLVAGCGGGGGSSKAAGASSASTSTTASGASAGFAAFTQCMTSHGIPASALRRGTGGGNGPPAEGAGGPPSGFSGSGAPSGSLPTPSLPAGVTQAQYQTAIQACGSQLPQGAGGGANSAQFAAYRNCLQLHGVTLPASGGPPASDQTASSATGGSAPTPGLGNLDTTNPTVQAALKACASLRPAPGSTSTSTSPG